MRIALLRAHPPYGWPTVHAPFGSPAKFGDPVVGLLAIRSGEVGALEGSLTDSPLLSGRELWQWYTNEPGGDPMLVESETTRAPHASTGWRHLYTGRPWEPQTRSYYYRHRWYDPHQARFLSRDALGYADGLLQYACVGGDPMNFVDVRGTARVYVHTGINEGPVDLDNILIEVPERNDYHTGSETVPDAPGKKYWGTDIVHNTDDENGGDRTSEPDRKRFNPQFSFWVPDEVAEECRQVVQKSRSWLPPGPDGKRPLDYSIGSRNCNRDTLLYLACLLSRTISWLRINGSSQDMIDAYTKALKDLNDRSRFVRDIPCNVTTEEGRNGMRRALSDPSNGGPWKEELDTLEHLIEATKNDPNHPLLPYLTNTGWFIYGATPIVKWGREHAPNLPQSKPNW